MVGDIGGVGGSLRMLLHARISWSYSLFVGYLLSLLFVDF